MDLNINLQDIDALEGDGLDAGNGNARPGISQRGGKVKYMHGNSPSNAKLRKPP